MMYQYAAVDDSNDVIEREFPMSGDIPQSVEENGKVYKRIWTSNFIVPYHFSHPFKFDYGKSPSRRKHVY